MYTYTYMFMYVYMYLLRASYKHAAGT